MKIDAGLQKSGETTKVATTAKDLEPSVFFCLIGKMVYVFRLAVMHDVNVGVRRFRFR